MEGEAVVPVTPVAPVAPVTPVAPVAPVAPVVPGQEWRSHIPADMTLEPSLQQIKDVPTLIKSYVHAQKLIGTDKIAAPKESWTDDQWNEFYDKAGRPGTPDKYPALAAEKAAAMGLDPNGLKSIQDLFHKAGLTTKQAAKVLEGYADQTIAATEAQRLTAHAFQLKTQEGLQKQYGDSLPTKLDVARTVVRQFGTPEVGQLLDQTGLGNHPGVIAMMIKIGESMLEDKASGNGLGLMVGESTSATQKIKELKNDDNFMKKLGNAEAIGHNDATAVWLELHRKAFPNKQ